MLQDIRRTNTKLILSINEAENILYFYFSGAFGWVHHQFLAVLRTCMCRSYMCRKFMKYSIRQWYRPKTRVALLFGLSFPVQILLKLRQCGRMPLHYFSSESNFFSCVAIAGGTYFKLDITIFSEIFIFQKCTILSKRRKKMNTKKLRHMYHRTYRTSSEQNMLWTKCLPSFQRYNDQNELNDKPKGTSDARTCTATTKFMCIRTYI